jgi:hypothetical protein
MMSADVQAPLRQSPQGLPMPSAFRLEAGSTHPLDEIVGPIGKILVWPEMVSALGPAFPG